VDRELKLHVDAMPLWHLGYLVAVGGKDRQTFITVSQVTVSVSVSAAVAATATTYHDVSKCGSKLS